MDEVDTTTDPVATETQVETDTQEVIDAPPTDGDGGHGEEVETPSQETPTTEQKPEVEPELTEAQKREEGKLKQYQDALAKAGIKDLSEIESLVQIKQAYSNIEERAKKDPETYKEALIKFNDLSSAEADQVIANMKAQGFWQAPESVVTPTGSIDIRKIVDQAKNELRTETRAEEQQRRALEGLTKAYPELNTKDEAKIEANREMLRKADYLARAEIQVNPELSYEEAVLQTYGRITGKTAEQIAKAKEDGIIEGLATATTKSGASSSAPVGQQSNKTPVNLSEMDRASARAMKMTDEEYVKYGSSKETYAE